MTGITVVLLMVKASVLLAIALLAARALRRASAVRRHRLWSAAFVALVALPPLALTLPALRVPVPGWRETGVVSSTLPQREASRPVASVAHPAASNEEAPITEAASVSQAAPAVVSPSLPSLRSALVGIWLAGLVTALVALVISLIRVGRLSASAREIDDPDWNAARDRVTQRLGYARRVRVLVADGIVTPMAGGVVRPTVFVPSDAMTWDSERRDIVLAHEIAHLASRDPLRHLVSRFAFTLYWFHPLAWLAVRQSTADCEQACDEAVLALGFRPSTYARVLLEFADTAPLRVASAALPIVKRARLESRLMAILDSSPRPSARRRALLPLAGAAALTLSLAAAQPSTSAAVTVATDELRADPVVVTPEKQAPTAKPAALASPIAKLATVPAVAAVPMAIETPVNFPERACWSGNFDADFTGTISSSGSGSRTIVQEQIGRRGNDRVVQKTFSDIRACMIAEGSSAREAGRPSDWIGHAPRVILETEQRNDVRRMEIVGNRVTWTINGQARPVDDAADAWRRDLLAVLDATWEVSTLRGHVSTLRGEISTIYGQRSTLQGQISTLQGEVSTMRGQISSLRGEESSLRGEISSIRGHLSSLQGAISSEQGAISSLKASSWDGRTDVSSRIRRHEDEIDRLQGEIRRYDTEGRVREVERRIAALDTERKVADIERRIREFDLDGRIAEINERIAELGVSRRVSGIEREIDSLDAEERARDIELRRDAAVSRLRATLGRE